MWTSVSSSERKEVRTSNLQVSSCSEIPSSSVDVPQAEQEPCIPKGLEMQHVVAKAFLLAWKNEHSSSRGPEGGRAHSSAFGAPA